MKSELKHFKVLPCVCNLFVFKLGGGYTGIHYRCLMFPSYKKKQNM
jgi:hypothetical protein